MKISEPAHKKIIWETFFEKTGQFTQDGVPRFETKSFHLEKLADAGSAKKKLGECINEQTSFFNAKEIEFTPSETAIIKDLFDKESKNGFNVDLAESVLSLKDIFDGKSSKDKKE